MAKAAKDNINNATGINAQQKAFDDLFIIGIGASAGGLQALDALFSSVPNDKVAYVIVQHLSSEHRSMLAELISRHSVLEVVEAQPNMPVEKNKVYVIPNNKVLTLKNNSLQLAGKSNAGRSTTINAFFKSLAADKGHRAIGIIMSGTGTDGTEGLVAIKKAGGLVIAQDPATARFDGMPRNAISTGYADFVLAPEAMPQEILNYIKVTPIEKQVTDLVNSETESIFQLVLDLVHERTGLDFNNYKRPTIIRRISRRMAMMNLTSLPEYLDYLNLHPEETETLGKEFLIGVTRFFRDPEAYHVLETKVIPDLVERKKGNEQLRVWIAGCSTGEEAYSIAILIRECLDKAKKELEVKVFASDIDREALDHAGKGMYTLSSLADVSEERLDEFFVKEEGRYRICQRVRRMVIFAPHNVTNDPPFSRIDLASCRNMLIYLNAELQKKVIRKFHYALQMGGYLFLGPSESSGDLKSFVEVSKKWKIYRNVEPAFALGMDTMSAVSRRSLPVTEVPGYVRDMSARQPNQHSYSELLSEAILDEYDYAAVFVDDQFDVLHGMGKYKKYLDLPENQFTINLLKLVPPDLAVNLGSLLRRALRDREKVAARGIQVRMGNSIRFINVVVKPFLNEKKLQRRLILVVFSEDQPQTLLESERVIVLNENQYEARMQELELELQHTKEDLQAVVEELETSNEELQSTNEELLSSNEELQSTNEELQSLNEELHTINAEHQYKIKELMELDDDLNNYFRSTDIGQIFVDRKLVIRKFTPAATRLINLIENDIGRSIYQISTNLRYENMVEDIRHVIASNEVVSREVQDINGVWYQSRILPYITQERKIDGAIIIFILINELKSLHLLHTGILDSSPNAILTLKAIRNRKNSIIDFELGIVNHRAQELLGSTEGGLAGKTLWKEYPDILEQGMFQRFVHVVETGEQLTTEQQQQHSNQPLWLHIAAVKFNDGLVLTLHNITERKLYEQALKQQQEEIKASAERFRVLLEAMPHITWTNNLNGERTTFNAAWYKYTGLPQEESVGWGWKKAIHPDDLDQLLQYSEEALATGSILNVQARIHHNDSGQYRWHLIRAVPICTEPGEITMWIGTATDIQDQKDAEEANIQFRLSQQRDTMKAVLQAQEAERFTISEALHNSLGQILYASKLNLESLVPDNPEHLKTKNRVEKFLDEAIAVTRNLSFELNPTVLRDFGLKTAVDEMIKRLNNSKLHISSEIVGLNNRLDFLKEISLYRIIQELLNNVIKHAQATRASVEITCKDNKLTLRVQDNGIGIDKDKDKQLNGIGLRNIRNRVELLDGKLEIKSAKGKGTLVQICCSVG